MTIEEKARAYDDALNWMRELYPGLHGATKEDAEHYFPELRESEDERIRQGIVETIKQCTDMLDPKNQKRMLAYLEKQKEQKPVEWSEEDEQYLLVCKNALSKYQRSDQWDANIISNWLENRLKSLRPQSHWKPNEYLLSLVKKVASGEMLTHMEQMSVERLYDDLQKL